MTRAHIAVVRGGSGEAARERGFRPGTREGQSRRPGRFPSLFPWIPAVRKVQPRPCRPVEVRWSRPIRPSPRPADGRGAVPLFAVRSWAGRRARDGVLYKARAFLLREDPKMSPGEGIRASERALCLPGPCVRRDSRLSLAWVALKQLIHSTAAYGDGTRRCFP